MIKNFSVPNPCHEHWGSMQPQENGRYCGSYEKVVIDFTNKTEQEIIAFITTNAEKKMCGTFKTAQLLKTNSINNFQKQKSTVRFLAAVLWVFGISLFSCNSDEEKNNKQRQETTKTTTGVMIAPPDTTKFLHKNDSITKLKSKEGTVCNTTTGVIVPEIVIPTEITTGEITEPIEQHDTIKVRKPNIVQTAEQMPAFNRSNSVLNEYIQNNLTYPQAAIDNGVQGTVYVTFVIKDDGSIDDPQILKGISPECDAEALKVVRNMPKWTPGKNHGEPVNVKFNLPIRFRLK